MLLSSKEKNDKQSSKKEKTERERDASKAKTNDFKQEKRRARKSTKIN